jgi:phosphate starvation-inducible protein PhoH and related proteins
VHYWRLRFMLWGLAIEHKSTAFKNREASHSASLEVESTSVLLALSGPQMSLLGEVARQTGAEVSLRGNVIYLAGREADVRLAHRFLSGAAELVSRGVQIGPEDVARSVRELKNDGDASLVELLDEAIIVSPRRRPIAAKSPAQRQYITTIRTRDLTFGIGPAGTGKTYLAMAMAAAALMEKRVKRIILTRPAVEAGEKLGFLPGDLAEKVNPYLRPLYDALHDMLEFDRVEQLRERGQIEVAPLAFMRGRTLNDCFVILDEAQNATSEQMRMFLTRLGFGSKAVVTGDITQTDLPRGARSGLREARDLLNGIEGIGFCHFTDVDVVRHPLVQKIIVAYEERDRVRSAEAAERRAERERLSAAARGAVERAREPSPESDSDPLPEETDAPHDD